MTANSSAYPEILCIRVPKGTEKRIRALYRSLHLRRPDVLRLIVETGLYISAMPLVQGKLKSGETFTIDVVLPEFDGLDKCITTGKDRR